MPEPREIDRLIEQGLSLYGQGQLDEALAIWEQALSIDPDNPQANSYVDYVRMNYELLTTERDEEPGDGFAFDEEPYKIEVAPGELAAPQAPAYADPSDEGWFIESEVRLPSPDQSDEPGPDAPRTISLEADEPPALEDAPTNAHKPVSFDDETREYEKGAPAKHLTDPGLGMEGRRPAEPRADDNFETLTPGFTAQILTEVKKRDLGFVQPRAELPLKAPPPDEPDPAPRAKQKTVPPEVKITVRTPEVSQTDFTPEGKATSTNAPTAELDPRDTPKIAAELAANALVSTLPTPLRHARAITPVAVPPPPPPPAVQRPASGEINVPVPEISKPKTRDLPLRELISAPTRDLGIVPLRIPMNTPSDEETTKELDMRKVKAAIESTSVPVAPVEPLDPIDTRALSILDEIDATAPDDETKDDKLRRRITTLLDKAMAWASADRADEAVAAVDLALSEDPNSALAQKLITRNRDAIMGVFQDFIGELDRVPVLAKPMSELAKTPISPRAAFLLSRVDGALTIDEILDVSGMPRMEAYRYLSQLLLRGILR